MLGETEKDIELVRIGRERVYLSSRIPSVRKIPVVFLCETKLKRRGEDLVRMYLGYKIGVLKTLE